MISLLFAQADGEGVVLGILAGILALALVIVNKSRHGKTIDRWILRLFWTLVFVIFFGSVVFIGPVSALVAGLVVSFVVTFICIIFMWVALAVIAPIFRLGRGKTARAAERLEERRREDMTRKERVAYERGAPQREEAESHRTAEQRRRDDARASALLSFTFYSAKLGNRFSRQDFDQYVTTYMGDTNPPDVVEQRGKALIAIFEKHLADVSPATQSSSLESITQWYQSTKAQILGLPLDQEVKDERLAELERRFSELLSSHMEQARP